jgi:hypothetical protein
VHAAVEEANDGPPLGHVTELVQGAEIAEEAGGFVRAVEPDDRVQQRLGVRRSPVVRHVSPSSSSTVVAL